MPTPIIEQSVFIEDNISTPTVGDTNYSVTVDNTIQNLANRTKWIKDNIVLTDTLGDYTPLSTTSSISGGLDTRVTNLETDLYTNTIVSLSGSSFSPDGLADIYSYALSGSATINAPSSIPNGQTIIFKLTQPVGGNATLTLADGSGLTWKKPGGSLTLTTTGNKEDILTVIRIGTNLYTSLVNNF